MGICSSNEATTEAVEEAGPSRTINKVIMMKQQQEGDDYDDDQQQQHGKFV